MTREQFETEQDDLRQGDRRQCRLDEAAAIISELLRIQG